MDREEIRNTNLMGGIAGVCRAVRVGPHDMVLGRTVGLGDAVPRAERRCEFFGDGPDCAGAGSSDGARTVAVPTGIVAREAIARVRGRISAQQP
jgi:hypothetical protein